MKKRKAIQKIRFRIPKRILDELTAKDGKYKRDSYYKFTIEIYSEEVNHFGANGHLYESGSNKYISVAKSTTLRASSPKRKSLS